MLKLKKEKKEEVINVTIPDLDLTNFINAKEK